MDQPNKRNLNVLIVILALVALVTAVLSVSSYLTRHRGDQAHWQQQFGAIAEQAGRSVVAITSEQETGIPSLTTMGAGSGFIIDPAGYLLTNEHVVHKAERITVTLADRRKYEAMLVAGDVRSDLAILKIECDGLIALPFAAPQSWSVGDVIIALGNPFNTGADGTAIATFGYINGLNKKLASDVDPYNDRFYDNLIQTDAMIQPGNSGGPLVNLRGEAIGINTAMGQIGTTGLQFGFAIALDERTQKQIQALITEGEITHAFLGVQVVAVDRKTQQRLDLKELSGAAVIRVLPGTPAMEGGLRVGDVIRGINNQRIYNPDDVIGTVNDLSPGSEAAILVLRREGEKVTERTLKVRLARRRNGLVRGIIEESGQDDVTCWGMTVKPLTPWRRTMLGLSPQQRGVLVYEVLSGSPAEAAGLTPGVIITAIGGEPIDNLDDFVIKAGFEEALGKMEWIPTPNLP
ncbi:MAG: trypsin-like peptidase domain-containing protein [Sedimentisphaerales bacterium]|nr:trypsin-like peptidase domain-containing protein [Sedimentisphaerales bacterium]